MFGKYLLLALATLLILSCGGPAKSTRITGIYYQVKPGDTLSKIAKTYQISPRKLAEANKLPQPNQLTEGMVIFIPDAEQIIEKAPPPAADAAKTGDAKVKPPVTSAQAKTPVETKGAGMAKKAKEKVPPAESMPSAKQDPEMVEPTVKKEPEKAAPGAASATVRKTPISQPLWQSPSAKQEGSLPLPEQTKPREPSALPKESLMAAPGAEEIAPSEKGRFTWPVKGKVVSRFGVQPNGMYYNHIRIVSRENASVTAAAPGTVIFSAPLKEFGETIIVKHDQRFATVYTHLGTRMVKIDHRVRKGEQIGLAGKSEIKNDGYIHFEIRDNNKSRNPLLFLP